MEYYKIWLAVNNTSEIASCEKDEARKIFIFQIGRTDTSFMLDISELVTNSSSPHFYNQKTECQVIIG